MYIDVAGCGGFTLPEPGAYFVRFEMIASIKLLVCRLLWALWPVTGLLIGLLFGWYGELVVVYWLSCCGGIMASVGLIEAQGLIIVGRMVDWMVWIIVEGRGIFGSYLSRRMREGKKR